MKNDYEYQVWPERKILIRLSSKCTEIFCPGKDEEWQAAPHLDSIRSGGGDFVWYRPVSEKEAEQYMEQFSNNLKITSADALAKH